MADYVPTIPLTSVFTPSPKCSSSWTYEASYYNSVPNGILIQNDLPSFGDTDCFPSGFNVGGRATTIQQVFSPGACPVGYKTEQTVVEGIVTSAVCCSSDFKYTSLFTVQGGGYTESIVFSGCVTVRDFGSSSTTVLARSSNTQFDITTVGGVLTMWGQPIYIAFQETDLSLFTSPTITVTVSPTASPKPVAIRTTRGTPQTTPTSATSTSANSTSVTSASVTSISTSSTSLPSTPVSSSFTLETATGNSVSQDPGKSGLSSAAIAGSAIGAAAVLGLLIGLFLLCGRHRSRGGKRAPEHDTIQLYSPADPFAVPQQSPKWLFSELSARKTLTELDALSKTPKLGVGGHRPQGRVELPDRE